MRLGDEEIWFPLACGILVVVAAAIRFKALGTTLFEDEVWVAELVRRGGWSAHSYATPPLFYFVCRGWTAVRGFSDVALREPAAFFGVALCAVPFLAPLPRLTRFLWSTGLAFSSPLIFYSSRLKQYTLEALIAAVVIVLFLRWWATPSRGILAAFFAIAALGVMTLHGTIIVIGAMAIVCLARPRMLIVFAALIILWAVAYWGWLQPGPQTQTLHGDMDAWFRSTHRWVTSPRVLLDATTHWVGQALNLVRFWWIAITLAVAAWIVIERNATVPLLAIIPPVTVAAASVLHIYPYGEVRLMIFAFPGLFLLIAAAIAELARRETLLLLVVVPFVWAGTADDPYNRTYMQVSDLREMFTTIVSSPATVWADPSFAAPLRYYHPELDIRSATVSEPQGAGWYLQRGSTFVPRGATVVRRDGNVLAARVEH